MIRPGTLESGLLGFKLPSGPVCKGSMVSYRPRSLLDGNNSLRLQWAHTQASGGRALGVFVRPATKATQTHADGAKGEGLS